MVLSQPSLRRLLTLSTALSFLGPVLPAVAQDAASGTATPPAQVGEVATVSGTVSYNGAGSNGQWVAASANYPLTSNDSLFTQASSRAAVAIDSSRITLADSTELQMTGLDETTVAATQSQGEIFLSINYLQPNQSFTITTPRGTVAIKQNGNYDIQAGDQNTPTVVTVLAGEADITDPGASLAVQAGQAGVLTGTDQTTAQLGTAQRDAFMNELMAAQAQTQALPSYCAPVVQQMTGVSQLGSYGQWSQSAQYGAVWYPQVSSGWAPYREGHWSYVAPWGYTWVDNASWGFAPFHYGRWIDQDNRWGWVPAGDYSGGDYGPSYRPVYAPALVSFFGGVAAGITINALASGSVGWVPLAPNEPYYPPYRASQDYIRRINVVNVRNVDVNNITNVNNYYGNGRFAAQRLANSHAAYYMPAAAMSRGEGVNRYGHGADAAMLASARPVGAAAFQHGGQPGGGGGAAGGHGFALPPPNVQHRNAPAPQPSAFAQRHALPQATLSHSPAVPQPGGGYSHFSGPNGANGQGNNFQHPGQPALARPNEAGAAHGFANNPGFRPPPAPPGAGQHLGQAAAPPNFHPQNEQHGVLPDTAHPGLQPGTAHPGLQPAQQQSHFGEAQHAQQQLPHVQQPGGEQQLHAQQQFHPQEQQHMQQQLQHAAQPNGQQQIHTQPQFHPQDQQQEQQHEQQHVQQPNGQQQIHTQQQFHPQEQQHAQQQVQHYQQPQHQQQPQPQQHQQQQPQQHVQQQQPQQQHPQGGGGGGGGDHHEGGGGDQHHNK